MLASNKSHKFSFSSHINQIFLAPIDNLRKWEAEKSIKGKKKNYMPNFEELTLSPRKAPAMTKVTYMELRRIITL